MNAVSRSTAGALSSLGPRRTLRQGPCFREGDYFPVTLAKSGPSEQLMSLFSRWLCCLDWDFMAAKEPWVPVGCIGPLLMLGHHPLATQAPCFPSGVFQPVVLEMADYHRHLAACRANLAGREPGQLAGEFLAPRVRVPQRFILPNALQAALQFMVEYCPHAPGDLERIRRLALRAQLGPEDLPEGYAAAAQLLCRKGVVVDMRGLQSCESPIPEMECFSELGVVPIAVEERRLWASVPSAPDSALEDRLLGLLGDGWSLGLCLEAVPGEERQVMESGGPCGYGRRSRVDIQEKPAAGEALASGVIVITEGQIGKLADYDPRRPDPDPATLFLRELSAAVRAGASDLHLEPGVDRFRIRARVNGLLEEWLETGPALGQAIVGAAKEMIGMPAERFQPQDAACTVRHGSEVIGVRVSSFPIRKRRQKLVLRFLPRRGAVPLLSDIMPPREARMLLRAGGSAHGLILFCGPTGSGKTTTVFSTLSALNRPENNILTLEDPVEYELEGVNQAELDVHRDVGWDVLLKGFLRQDPDLGLIGEIRDLETASTAIRQALTGHVVFATLHTMSCARTVERMLDMGVDGDVLASALSLVVSQRLVRRLCPECRVSRPIAMQERRCFEARGMLVPARLHEPSECGCPHCRQGYRGRMAAVEMLPVTREVSLLVEARVRSRDYEAWMKQQGFLTLFESALRLVAEGHTSFAEAEEWKPVWDDFDFSA